MGKVLVQELDLSSNPLLPHTKKSEYNHVLVTSEIWGVDTGGLLGLAGHQPSSKFSKGLSLQVIKGRVRERVISPTPLDS